MATRLLVLHFAHTTLPTDRQRFTCPSLRRPRLLLAIFAAATTLLALWAPYWYNIQSLPGNHKQNYLMLHTPTFLHDRIRYWWADVGAGDLGPPRGVPELYDAKWPGSWDVPPIRLASESQLDVSGSAQAGGVWLALYVFSTSSPESRARRALIREHHPLDSLSSDLRSLVSVKFVLGYPNPNAPDSGGTEAQKEAEDLEEIAIREEQHAYHDVVRLKGLADGENMNQGKSWEWAKWAGQEDKEAQWIFKCDDDTYVLLPNLLDILLTLDPSQPTYLGGSTGHWPGFLWYFGGMMYGFSWGVARTIATSEVHRDMYTWSWHEDALMGEMMYNLPSMPLCDPDGTYSLPSHNTSQHTHQPTKAFGFLPSSSPAPTCLTHSMPWDTPPPGGWNSPPASPDARTGLVRVDFEGKMGAQWDWWTAGPESAVAWHPVKDDQQYVDSYHRARDYFFIRKNGQYDWAPPDGWEHRLIWAERREDHRHP